MSLNAQFVGLTAAAPEEQEGTAIGVYYLSQQVGMIVGVGSFAALLETVFSNNLRRALGSFPGIDEVSQHQNSRHSSPVRIALDRISKVQSTSTELYPLDNQRRTRRRAIGCPAAHQDTGCGPFGLPI